MFDTLNQALALRETYKGKYMIAQVVVNVDPLNQGRIQVNAPGLYDPDTGAVPWVGPMKKSPFGMSKDYGVYGSPAVGSDVAILLQDGDAHYPMYVCDLQRYANDAFASGTTWGFKDPFGNMFHVDLTTGAIVFNAKAGVTFTIGADGSLSVTSKANTTITAPTVDINANVNIHGNVNIQGNVATEGSLTNNGVNVGSTHIHPDPQGGTTGTPE